MTPSQAPRDRPHEGILGIVVTFNTARSSFLDLLNRFSRALPLVVCDNSTDLECQKRIRDDSISHGMIYLPMNGNAGIAYAQNRGIEYAISAQASHVLLIDDDSQLSAAEALQLREAYFQLQALGKQVGAVSARAFDSKGKNLSNVPDLGGYGFTPCSLLNSSGSMISIEAIETVGLMNEDLFIDLVDFDWGWRALNKGYGLFVVEAIRFQHALGNGTMRFLGLRAGIPSPIRHYYQTRNTLYLISKPYVPLRWKAGNIVRIPLKIIAFLVFVKPRLIRLSYFLKGILHGISGNLGPKYESGNS